MSDLRDYQRAAMDAIEVQDCKTAPGTGKAIPEAELMLSLPSEDWEWLLVRIGSLEHCTHPDNIKRRRRVGDYLTLQFNRQLKAI